MRNVSSALFIPVNTSHENIFNKKFIITVKGLAIYRTSKVDGRYRCAAVKRLQPEDYNIISSPRDHIFVAIGRMNKSVRTSGKPSPKKDKVL